MYMHIVTIHDVLMMNKEPHMKFKMSLICTFNRDQLGLNKKVFDWRNPTDPIYPADPIYFY